MPIPDVERSMRSSIAAHESWAATEDRTARTSNARRAHDQKFLDAAGGDPVRAEHLRRAHFKRLALASARSRRLARENTVTAETAEAELAALNGWCGMIPATGQSPVTQASPAGSCCSAGADRDQLTSATPTALGGDAG